MRHMIRLFIFAIVIAPLVGCMTASQYEEILDSWVGSSEQALIVAWGPATSH